MALAAGTRLGAYEITALIGAGGMGEVYRARDTRLNRDVALKVLPELFAADSERLARFKREAQLLAALNHPNIAAIYGFGFRSGNKVKTVALAGGPASTLADSNGTQSGTWNRDGVILFASSGVGNPIRAIPASGGTPTPVTTVDRKNGETQHWDPFFLPNGRHFLYLAIGSSTSPASANGIYVASLDSTERRLLVPGGSNAMYARGHLFYLQQQMLRAQPFDPERLEFAGEAVTIAEQVVTGGGSGIRGAFTVSETGILLYQTGAAEIGGNADPLSQLVWFDRSGKRLGTIGEPARFRDAELAPDGRRVAVNLFDTVRRTRDVWLVDAARGLRTRFTFDPRNEGTPVWAPDGTRLVFNAEGNLYLKASSGAGDQEELLADNRSKSANDWSSDGRFIVFSVFESGGGADLWLLPLFGDRKPFPFLQTSFAEGLASFSPDGRWIAYVTNESGRNEVLVAPVPGHDTSGTATAPPTPGDKWQVSTAGGSWPRWRRDGEEIFYLAADNKLMAAEVDGRGSAFAVGAVRPLFDMRGIAANFRAMYNVSPDGQRFLVVSPLEEPTPSPTVLTLLVNWPVALRK
ncbi:MAG: PD40 domain-containing protein [Acidobacteria bacterium]|nr:PD40 domain-containing protein [Acidobacteriota bacterium]